MEFPIWIYLVLFATGIMAGAVDSMAGGGGIITLPVLLSCGIPAPLALGTNKLQASFGSVAATVHYSRMGFVNLCECYLGIFMTLVGAVGGTLAVQSLDPHVIEQLIPILLVGILLYTIFQPHVGLQDHPPRLSRGVLYTLCGLGIGFYDGFLGPGTGSFWTMAFIAIMGYNFAKATGTTKVMNATSNLVSLALFAMAGKIDLGVGLTMGIGQVVGARLGSGLVMRKGARFVRPIFLVMVSLTLLRLLYMRVVQGS